MSRLRYLFDSTLFIDFLNRRPESRPWIIDIDPAQAAVSSVTCAEVLAGCKTEDQWQTALELLQMYHCYPVTFSDAKLAAKARLEFNFKLPDAFQAAVALQHKLTLITRNTKDFDPKIHKFVNIPYRLK